MASVSVGTFVVGVKIHDVQLKEKHSFPLFLFPLKPVEVFLAGRRM